MATEWSDFSDGLVTPEEVREQARKDEDFQGVCVAPEEFPVRLHPHVYHPSPIDMAMQEALKRQKESDRAEAERLAKTECDHAEWIKRTEAYDQANRERRAREDQERQQQKNDARANQRIVLLTGSSVAVPPLPKIEPEGIWLYEGKIPSYPKPGPKRWPRKRIGMLIYGLLMAAWGSYLFWQSPFSWAGPFSWACLAGGMTLIVLSIWDPLEIWRRKAQE